MILPITIGLLVAQPLPSAAIPMSRWSIEDKTSSLDGEKTFSATLKADQSVANIIGAQDSPTLGIDCTSKGFFTTIFWPDFIDKSYNQYDVKIVWKLDDGPPRSSQWIATTRDVGQIGRSAQAWLALIANGHKLIVRVPDQHGGQETTFSLDGILAISETLSKRSCG